MKTLSLAQDPSGLSGGDPDAAEIHPAWPGSHSGSPPPLYCEPIFARLVSAPPDGWRPTPQLLCSVIQTWKVNNTLTSSGVCVLLHGYFPEYLALSKRGALDCTSKARSLQPLGGAAAVARPFYPPGVPPGHQLGTDGGFCSKSRCTLDIDTDSFWLGGVLRSHPQVTSISSENTHALTFGP